MTNWPPSHTLRLARLAHPGRDWKANEGDPLRATAVIGRELKGWNMIGFNADSLDDLARCELKVCEDRPQYVLREILENICDEDNIDCAFATPDQRRRALIAVMDAHPEIEGSK